MFIMFIMISFYFATFSEQTQRPNDHSSTFHRNGQQKRMEKGFVTQPESSFLSVYLWWKCCFGKTTK